MRICVALVVVMLVAVMPGAFVVSASAEPGSGKSGQPGKMTGTVDGPNIGRAIHVVADGTAGAAGLVVDLARETNARFEVLENPDRLVVDLEGVVFPGSAALSSRRPVGLVAAWRAGLFMLGQSRIVMDLTQPALVERIDFVRQSGIVRLVAQIKPVERPAFRERAASDRARRLALRTPEIEMDPARRTPARKASDKPLLVIDPGHGGIDPGASGVKGEAEKDIVLAVAKALKAVIEKDGRIEVQLTREDDRFLALGERVAFGRSRGAALFVSLHADSLVGERDVRGASVYTLSDRASDANAARAAEKENRADLLAGVEGGEDKREGVEDILFDLARRETRLFSQRVARTSIAALQHGARLHKTPLRSAGFRVLRAPDMPSILVELGYLSNSDDVAALSGESSRARLARALGKALIDFVISGRNAVAPLGSQGQTAPEIAQ
jgi:N-acetylmuramoyl-L-alanine amidase